jgi:hypothetical protein
MDRAFSAWTRLAALCLTALGAFHLYRSVALAITADEAFTYLDFVGVSWLKLATSYDANHHVLHSVLCKLSTGLFGVQEWSLRLPAVLGCWIYFAFAWRLSRRLCGEGPAMLAGVLWMSCLPQIAEYLSLARGYSLGLAFWTAAMFHALEEKPKWDRVSALMGLSIASNLVFAIPCAALGCLLWIKTREWRQLTAPALAVIVVFLAVPLQRAGGENYYFGAKDWASAVHSLLLHPWLKGAAGVVGLMALVLARRSADVRWVLQIALLSLAVVTALFTWLHVPLPYERTGIYLLAMLGMLAGMACRLGRFELPAAALAAVGAVAMVLTLSPTRSEVWKFDSYSRGAMALIREDAAGTPRVAASFPMERSVEFYRVAWGLRWPGCEKWRAGLDADYVVWRTDLGQGALPPGFTAIGRDERSGVIVGRRSALLPE